MEFRGKVLELSFYTIVFLLAAWLASLALRMPLFAEGVLGPGVYPLAALAGVLLSTLILFVQSLRAREVRLFSHYLEGIGNDVRLRAMAAAMAARLGRRIRVVTKNGVGVFSAMYRGLREPPDGRTLTVVTSETYDLPDGLAARFCLDRLTPVCRLYFDPDTLVVGADAPWREVDDLLAERNPVRLGIAEHPEAVHPLGDWLRAQGLDIRTVCDEESQMLLARLHRGELDAAEVGLSQAVAEAREGRLRCLGVTADTRSPLAPDVPTFAERGRPFVSGKWAGLALPGGASPELVERWAHACREALRRPAPQAAPEAEEIGWSCLGPAEFTDFLRAQSAELPPALREVPAVLPRGKLVGLVVAILAMAAFPAAMSALGFALTAGLFLFVLMSLLWPTFECKAWTIILPVSGGVAFGLYALFWHLFHVRFPEGSLTGF